MHVEHNQKNNMSGVSTGPSVSCRKVVDKGIMVGVVGDGGGIKNL